MFHDSNPLYSIAVIHCISWQLYLYFSSARPCEHCTYVALDLATNVYLLCDIYYPVPHRFGWCRIVAELDELDILPNFLINFAKWYGSEE